MKITTIQRILENSVEMAAPATPILKPKIKIALPTIFTQFEITEIFIGNFALPPALKKAEPALKRARNGNDIAVIKK
jgi:hypothetical protein